jgi:hypothetical protein
MANSFIGEWHVEYFDEFEMTITEGKIVIKQGDVILWAGTFNTDIPADGEFSVISERDPDANLPYIEKTTMSLEFPYSNGELTYVDPVLQAGLDFTKVK